MLFLGLAFLISRALGSFPSELRSNRPVSGSSPSFEIDYASSQFRLDGEPFRYISGSIHYFRIHPNQWQDRLKKVRALGFNAIEFYIPWNFHVVTEGHVNFDGNRDFVKFINMANDLGLYSILRVGPYICGEWENGGLPWWLLKKINPDNMQRTSQDRNWLDEVDKWFAVLLPKVKPLLRNNGGPVLMVQIENEYGSYKGTDRQYTLWLRDLTRKHLGEDVVLFTTDGGSTGYLKNGMIPDVYPTVDFGVGTESSISNAFKAQRIYAPRGPLVNSEFYPGWLTLWGDTSLNVPSSADIVRSSQIMYNMNASFNYYMIHGGTNFEFWNGAETNAPVVTSYDYSAPLSEAGDVTESYLAIRDWIASLDDWPIKQTPIPPNSQKKAYGVVLMKKVADIIDGLTGCIYAERPVSFEFVDQAFGFLAYQTKPQSCGILTLTAFKDFAYVFSDNKYEATLTNYFNGLHVNSTQLHYCNPSGKLTLLLENQGRLTYETINDYKGIYGDVLINGNRQENWEHCKIDVTKVPTASESPSSSRAGWYTGSFEINDQEPADTFIDTRGWGKGTITVNGNNFGKYWPTQGPQMTLYIPAPFLKRGRNDIILFELDATLPPCAEGLCVLNLTDHAVFQFGNNSEGSHFNQAIRGQMRKFIFLTLVFVICQEVASLNPLYSNRLFNDNSSTLPSFEIDYINNQFLLDRKPFRYISGSIHYFRIHPDLWKDRLQKVRALGLNAIQFYIPWNYHVVREGEVNFSGNRNFTKFIELANDLGLYTLLRVGPFIAGEWENSGLPWWLLKKINPQHQQRTLQSRYWMKEVERWWSVLLPKVKPLLRQNGGPVLMVQIENEYGSFSHIDRQYTIWLREMAKKLLGFNAFLYTSPLVNSEFYPAWFMAWGQKKLNVPSARDIVRSMRIMYNMSASINFYMIHGGSNFEFWSGSGWYAPITTSYDYSAPISEAGDITENYLAIRDLIASLPDWSVKQKPIPSNSRKRAYGAVQMTKVANSFTGLTECTNSAKPLSFEFVDQPFGFLVYQTKLSQCGKLTLTSFKDFAYVYSDDDKYEATLINNFNKLHVNSTDLRHCNSSGKLTILVENQGRCTGNDFKGILGDVTINGRVQKDWKHCKIDVTNVPKETGELSDSRAGWYTGKFVINDQQPEDTFIDTRGWGKGTITVNGHNFGRYWPTAGPQMTLYIPAPFLKRGTNEIVLFELNATLPTCGKEGCHLALINKPIFHFDE